MTLRARTSLMKIIAVFRHHTRQPLKDLIRSAALCLIAIMAPNKTQQRHSLLRPSTRTTSDICQVARVEVVVIICTKMPANQTTRVVISSHLRLHRNSISNKDQCVIHHLCMQTMVESSLNHRPRSQTICQRIIAAPTKAATISTSELIKENKSTRPQIH